MDAALLKRWWGLAISVLCIGGIVVLWDRQPERPAFRLNDGSVVRLECVRYQRTPANGPVLQRLQIARVWLERRLGRPAFAAPFAPTNSLVCWFSRREKDTGRYLPLGEVMSAVALDKHGCEFRHASLGPFLWLRDVRPGRYDVSGGVLPSFPRREKNFKLRLYSQDRQLLGELDVPNPVYRRYPTWTPETLPTTRSLGTSIVTLAEFENVWGAPPLSFSPTDRVFNLAPEFRLPPDWELSDIDVGDATGNKGMAAMAPPYRRFPRRFPRSRPGEPLSVQCVLCTHESAWKLTATFYRKPQSLLNSEDTWTVPNLILPAPGQIRSLTVSTTWQGATVKLCAIAGPGEVTYSNGVPVQASRFDGSNRSRTSVGSGASGPAVTMITLATDKPQVLLQVTGVTEPTRLQGIVRSTRATSVCTEPCRAGDFRLLQIEPPDGAGAVDLVVVLQSPQAVEFLIRPKATIEDPSQSGVRVIPFRTAPGQ